LDTDEAGFTRNCVFNSRNTHIWSEENPHEIQERHFQQSCSLNVWVGIIENHLIGPYVLPRRLTVDGYLQFLNEVLPELLEEGPLAIRREMWYLHDGGPPHYAGQVRTWMDISFPNRWIGRAGPILWPPRSPDLNPCDFFVWGHMKQLVYVTPVNSIEELQLRVQNAAQEILDLVRLSWVRRAEACIANGGRHFEQLLGCFILFLLTITVLLLCCLSLRCFLNKLEALFYRHLTNFMKNS
jgi:hypothetical protein